MTGNWLKLLAALMVIVHSAAALQCTDTAMEFTLGDQAGNIYLVLMLTVIIIAIAYGAGVAVSNPNLVVLAKDELYHLAFSIVLLLAFSGVLLLSCNVMDFFFMNTFSEMESEQGLSCYESGNTIESVSTCYMTSAKADAERISAHYIDQYLDSLMWSTLSMSVAMPLSDTYTTTLGSYKRVVSNQYDTVLNLFIIPALVSISMQQLLLGFINNNIIAWIVPSAFLLRVIPPTRQMGNVLLALALSVYIIVPYMYTFNLAMYDVALTTEDCMSTVLGGDLHYYDALCDSVMDGYACWPYESTGTDITTACRNDFGFWMVARLVPQAFLLPNLTIALLVAFIGSLAKALKVIT